MKALILAALTLGFVSVSQASTSSQNASCETSIAGLAPITSQITGQVSTESRYSSCVLECKPASGGGEGGSGSGMTACIRACMRRAGGHN